MPAVSRLADRAPAAGAGSGARFPPRLVRSRWGEMLPSLHTSSPADAQVQTVLFASVGNGCRVIRLLQ